MNCWGFFFGMFLVGTNIQQLFTEYLALNVLEEHHFPTVHLSRGICDTYPWHLVLRSWRVDNQGGGVVYSGDFNTASRSTWNLTNSRSRSRKRQDKFDKRRTEIEMKKPNSPRHTTFRWAAHWTDQSRSPPLAAACVWHCCSTQTHPLTLLEILLEILWLPTPGGEENTPWERAILYHPLHLSKAGEHTGKPRQTNCS